MASTARRSGWAVLALASACSSSASGPAGGSSAAERCRRTLPGRRLPPRERTTMDREERIGIRGASPHGDLRLQPAARPAGFVDGEACGVMPGTFGEGSGK